MAEHIDIFHCPACSGSLEVCEKSIKCLQCHNDFQIKDGIPLLFCQNDAKSDKNVTAMVKSFYEETPFPNYEDTEDITQLIEKAKKGIYAQLLDQQIPFNTRVLEVGCGTGQLTNYLGISHRFMFGTDICFNSLKLANTFRMKHNLGRVGFYQMNLFKPIFKAESFPLVICHGVLHATNSPLGGFQSVTKLVQKNGYIIIGLYNKYGRVCTDIRRIIFRICQDRLKFLDPRLRNVKIGKRKKIAWFIDQYKHPQESKHTVREILRWFEMEGFDFINSVPKFTAFNSFSEDEKLFKPNPKGNWLDHFIMQASLLLTKDSEGGFFVMIGRKK